jgi:hypothetical protein
MSFPPGKAYCGSKEEEPHRIDALHLVIDYLSPIDSEESLP